jgi:hypothetical protein
MPSGFSKANNNWERRELVILEKNPFKTARELSDVLGRTPKAIRHMFSKLGVKRRKIINDEWSKKEVTVLRKNINNRFTVLKDCLPKRTEWAIKHKYNQLGLDRGSFSGCSYDFKKPVLSEDYAYFLGVLASDGWNDGNSIGLLVKDKEFRDVWAYIGKNLFDLKPKLRERDGRLKNHSVLYEVQFSSVKLCEFLGDFSKKNWFNNKNIEFIFKNKKLIAAFLSGYVDSDGCIGRGLVIAVSSGQDKIAEMLKSFGTSFVFCKDGIRVNLPLRADLKNWLNLRVKRKQEALQKW